MDKNKKNEVIENMVKLSSQISEKLVQRGKTIENIQYYKDFQFEKVGLGLEGAFVVKLKDDDVKEKQVKERKKDNLKDDTVYEIYDKNNILVAIVGKDGKVHFDEQFLDSLRNENEGYFNTLDFGEGEFELLEELGKDDIILTKTELEKESLRKNNNQNKSIKDNNLKDDENSKISPKNKPKYRQEINPYEKVTRNGNTSRHDSRD